MTVKTTVGKISFKEELNCLKLRFFKNNKVLVWIKQMLEVFFHMETNLLLQKF